LYGVVQAAPADELNDSRLDGDRSATGKSQNTNPDLTSENLSTIENNAADMNDEEEAQTE